MRGGRLEHWVDVRRRIRSRLARMDRLALTRLADVAHTVGSGEVALTFDDGPHPSSTPLVLDVLGELGVRATFFCVGKNADRHPDLIARTLAEGHVIGSHSQTHPHPAEITVGALTREYREGRRAVSQATGAPVDLFRPPHGHLDLPGAAVMRRLGLSPWLWSVDPTDWRAGITTQQVVEVASCARSGDVVLFHDWVEQPWAPEALDRSATITALPAVVRAVRARGLEFVPLGRHS